MHCPKNLEKNVVDYNEKRKYDNYKSTMSLKAENSGGFSIYVKGEEVKNLLFGIHLQESEREKLSIVATDKDNILLLFDNNLNGYSNCFEKKNLAISKDKIKSYNKFLCHSCKNEKFDVSLFFEYIDEDVLKEEDENIQDYSNSYQWIKISLKCCNCGKKYKNYVEYED